MALDRQRIPVLEVDATPLRVPDLVAELSRFVEEGSTRTVLGHNLHSVTLTLSDEGFRDLYQRSDVVLLDGAPKVLPTFGDRLSDKARRSLEKQGVEVQLEAMVTDVNQYGIEVKDGDGTHRSIETMTKVWAAGVAGSPLGAMLAEERERENA